MRAPNGISILRPDSHMWPASANVFLLRDEDGAILIDVGCGRQESYDTLKAWLADEGFSIADVHTILLSHAHPDHMGCMRFITQEISPRIWLHGVEIPLAADPQLLNETFDLRLAAENVVLENGSKPESYNILDYFAGLCPMSSAVATDELIPGETVEVGGFRLRVVHTPGHALGHCAFFEADRGFLLTGDAVGEVVAWYSPSQGGALGYLAGLERLAGLGASLILPSHGPNIAGADAVAAAIAHTRDYLLRAEERILSRLGPEPVTRSELCGRIYRNPVAQIFPGIQIIQSHLDKLESEGRISIDADGLISL